MLVYEKNKDKPREICNTLQQHVWGYNRQHDGNHKTADDIIRNLVFAERLLPDFKVGDKRIQFNRKDLQKTPNHVFSIASHIYKELQKYKNRRGIQLLPRKTALVSGLDPKHVFNKTLECLTKVARL